MLKKGLNIVLDLIFPRQCIGCRRADTWWCDQCAKLSQRNRLQCCYVCRKPSAGARTCPEHFEEVKEPERLLDRIFVAAHYSGNPLLKKAIKTLKYQKHPEDIAQKLGGLLSRTLKTLTPYSHSSIFILIPVPLHQERLKTRGFNQAQLLSEAIPLTIIHQLLTRVKPTPPQASTNSRKERLNNLKDAFQLNQAIDPTATYLLIDDVTTTGTTLEECCQLLKNAGAKRVWGAVVARN